MTQVPFPYAGELCALLAPLCWSLAVVGYRKSDLPPASMNLFKNSLALVLLSVTLIVASVPIPTDRPLIDWGILVVSGILGLMVGDTLFLEGLRRIGAARLALVDTAYAPVMVLLAWVFLGERPGWGFALGATAVVCGVAVASVDFRKIALSSQGKSEDSRANLAVGALMAFGATCATAISVILVKPILEQSSLIEVTWVRMLTGLVAQAAWVTLRGQWSTASVAFRPNSHWRTLIPAAVIGTYVALVLWLGGFKWADASVAAVLNQMATIYLLGLAWLVLGEPLSRRHLLGAALAVSGAIVIVLDGASFNVAQLPQLFEFLSG